MITERVVRNKRTTLFCKASMEFSFKQFSLDHSLSSMKVGTDAVLLSALIPRNQARQILDVGTGCGVVALLTAQFNPRASVTAIDIDPPSIAQARNNFASSPFADRMQAIETSLQDFADNKDHIGRFDLVVSNPPYFVDSLKAPKASRNIARHNDKLPFCDLVESISRLITPEARIAIILPEAQSSETEQLFTRKNIHLAKRVNIYPKAGRPIIRVVNIYAPDAASHKEESLTIRTCSGEYTPEYKTIVSEILL